MIKYYVSYKDYKKHNLNLGCNILDNLKMFKRCADENKYIVSDVNSFIKNSINISEVIDKIETSRTNITFMIELNEENPKKVHPIILKRYKVLTDRFLYSLNKDETLRLLDTNITSTLNYKELSNVKNVNIVKDGDYYKIAISKDEINSRKKYSIGEGKYIYTEDERLLNKYKDEMTVFDKVDEDTYRLKDIKVLILDSIGQDRIAHLSRKNYRFLYDIYYSSEEVYINSNDDETYNISSKRNSNSKKGYLILGKNLNTLLLDDAIEPFLKYLNIYELKDGKYIKTTINDYIIVKGYKYTKKPRNF